VLSGPTAVHTKRSGSRAGSFVYPTLQVYTYNESKVDERYVKYRPDCMGTLSFWEKLGRNWVLSASGRRAMGREQKDDPFGELSLHVLSFHPSNNQNQPPNTDLRNKSTETILIEGADLG
jgi:hypothetical protein